MVLHKLTYILVLPKFTLVPKLYTSIYAGLKNIYISEDSETYTKQLISTLTVYLSHSFEGP